MTSSKYVFCQKKSPVGDWETPAGPEEAMVRMAVMRLLLSAGRGAGPSLAAHPQRRYHRMELPLSP